VVCTAGALGAAAALGPYFSVEVAADEPGWLELAALVDEPGRMRDRVAVTRSLLADRCGLPAAAVAERPAASIWFLGLAARLVSPALGAAVVTGTVPLIAAGDVRWRPVDGGPTPIAVTGGRARHGSTSDDLAHLLYDHVVTTTVSPLAGAAGREFRLSPRVLWGNVASSVAGAATMIGVARPDLAARATQLAASLLSRGSLAGTGRYVDAGAAGSEPSFRRNNCCLFYRLPGGGTCGDCVLLSKGAPGLNG
jgi:ferric iron reductase protein FhuF